MRWTFGPRPSRPCAALLGALGAHVARGCLIALALQGSAFAQADTGGSGRVVGTARDASGLIMPGATVSVRNERTGETRETTTDSAGRYLVAGLTPSRYVVTAQLTGFAPTTLRDLQLLAGQEMTVDVTLAVAGQAESVTVVGEPPLL